MASPDYVFIRRRHPIGGAGLSHSETSGSKPVDGSPELVAVFRVLRRLPMPRHPSCARIRLARKIGAQVLASSAALRALRTFENRSLPRISIYVAVLHNLQLPAVNDRRPPVKASNVNPFESVDREDNRRLRGSDMLRSGLLRRAFTLGESRAGRPAP